VSAATQSALETASHGASLIGELTWVLLIGGAAIFALVTALVAIGVMSGPRAASPRRWVIGGGLVFPVVVLTGLLAYAFAVGAELSHDESLQRMRVHVVGKRWWWEVRYESPDGTAGVVLANELHLPVGCVADITLTSSDVIHSFWVPALAGKVDMIPGHENRLIVHADREGVYRGQCAEYCGAQHAQMALLVVVTSPAAFREWLGAQSHAAVEPADDASRLGRDAFFRGGCADCHAIRGTAANGTLGPDLTHVGSRRSLAAGALDNHVGTMAGWIADPQGVKPGSLMPPTRTLSGTELRALASYLVNLK
jgi:cytochrome c oxidase subunit II